MKKRTHSGLMWGAVLVFVAILMATAVAPGLHAQDCSNAQALASMSREQAEVCFSWDFD